MYKLKLECMTFEDNSFDIFITQDVFEHICNPDKALKEISRVLKLGEIRLFTVPLYPFIATKSRVRIEKGNVIPVLPAVYHGNQITEDGSLGTYDWGHDISKIIGDICGTRTEIYEFMR